MGQTPFLQAAQAYLDDCRRRRLRDATLRYYRMVLWRLAKVSGLAEVEELTLARVRAYQDQSAQLAAGSIRGFLRAIKTFSAWLAKEQLVRSDPLEYLILPRGDERVVVVPTDIEIIRILRVAEPRVRTLIVALIGTGLRVSDISSLDLADLRPGQIVVGRTKNRRGRLVPIDPALETILQLHVRDLRHADVSALFVSRLGIRVTESGVRRAVAAAARRADLDIAVGPHVLRHWHARDLSEHGAGFRELGARMGWKGHGLVERYAPVSYSELARDVGRYAPLIRLRDAGALDGLFPPFALHGTGQRSSGFPRAGQDRRRRGIDR